MRVVREPDHRERVFLTILVISCLVSIVVITVVICVALLGLYP